MNIIVYKLCIVFNKFGTINQIITFTIEKENKWEQSSNIPNWKLPKQYLYSNTKNFFIF